jgi:hypothetical protein
MYSGRGFPGILLGIFPRRFTCPVSGQLEKNAFRTSLIPVRLIRRKCVGFIRRKLESTSWRPRCGWAMRACKPCTVELEVGVFFKTQALQKVPPEDQSSGIRKAEKSLLTLKNGWEKERLHR